jgi:hypothetical protein
VSESDTTSRRGLPEGWTGGRIAAAAALALTVLILVVGATMIESGDEPYEDAGERIQALYDEGDIDAMMDAFAEGTIPAEQVDGTRNALQQILRPGVGVAEVSDPQDVVGVPIVRVTTEDRIDWCVRPDGRILPRCRVGEVAVDLTTDAPFGAVLTRADIPLEGPTQLTLALESTVQEPVRLRGLQLEAADGERFDAELVQAVNVVGSQPSEVDPENPTLAAGSTLYLTWLTDEDLSGRDLLLTWEDGEATLDLRRVDWFVD